MRIRNTLPVRRTLAGLLFGLAFTCASLTIAGFLLQRTAFDPDNSADAASVVLQDDGVRTELVNFISDNVATQLHLDGAQVRERVGLIASTPAGGKLMSGIIHDAHAHLIGEQKGPVLITGKQLAQATRMDAAAAMPAITLPVPKVRPLEIADGILGWLLPIAGIGTLVFFGIAFTAHPDRSALFKSLALGLVTLAVLAALLGYVVPKFVVPAINDSVWAHIPARLADDSRTTLIGLEVLLLGGAAALLLGTGLMRRRRRWSTPVNTYRYNEERRWS